MAGGGIPLPVGSSAVTNFFELILLTSVMATKARQDVAGVAKSGDLTSPTYGAAATGSFSLMTQDATHQTKPSATTPAVEGETAPDNSEETQEFVLGLLADPGVPERLAQWLRHDGRLADWLTEHGRGPTWRVEVMVRPLTLDEHGHMPMLDISRDALAEQRWDAVVLVTDLPRWSNAQPIAADYSTTVYAGMMSVPALGAFNLRRRAWEMIGHLVLEHLSPVISSAERSGGEGEETVSDDDEAPESAGRRGNSDRVHRISTPVRHIESMQKGIDQHIALVGFRGRLRLLAGMVKANRPWRLVPSLAPAMAGAAAGAAFGVFYSNIWMLADAFSPARLLLVNIVAVAGMIAWLFVYNGLWERSSNVWLREQAVLSNAATIVTVSTAVVYMYALLFAITVAASLAVIPGPFMQSTLAHPVGFGDYVGIAWLAASMGTIAGALGSGLADEESVRQAAYSRRENQRRQRQEAEAAAAEEGH